MNKQTKQQRNKQKISPKTWNKWNSWLKYMCFIYENSWPCHFSPCETKSGRLERQVKFQPQTAYLTVMLLLKICPLRYPFHRKFTVMGLSEKNIEATGILRRLWPNPHFCNCNCSDLHVQYVCCCCAHNVRWAETPPLLQWGGTQPRAQHTYISECHQYFSEPVKRRSGPYWLSSDWSLIPAIRQTA